jgi:hypothetical protein
MQRESIRVEEKDIAEEAQTAQRRCPEKAKREQNGTDASFHDRDMIPSKSILAIARHDIVRAFVHLSSETYASNSNEIGERRLS